MFFCIIAFRCFCSMRLVFSACFLLVILFSLDFVYNSIYVSLFLIFFFSSSILFRFFIFVLYLFGFFLFPFFIEKGYFFQACFSCPSRERESHPTRRWCRMSSSLLSTISARTISPAVRLACSRQTFDTTTTRKCG